MTVNEENRLSDAFVAAIKAGDLPALESLLDTEPNLLDAQTPEGVAPVVLAKYYGKEDVAASLLARGPRLDAFAAVVVGREGVIRAALDANPAVVRAYSSDGWTLLHLAAFFGHPEIVATLLDAGADVGAVSTNDQGNMPLHAALPQRNAAIVAMLLDAGADVNARQAHGYTPLHEAALIGDARIARLLLERGADSALNTESGETALDLARKNGHQDIVRLLEGIEATERTRGSS